MNRSHIAVAVAVLTAAAVTGCSSGADRGTWQLTKAADSAAAPAPAVSGSSGGPLAVGPGPTNYVVQRQPAAGSCLYRHSPTGEPLPDPRCTPGAISPKVTQETLAHTVCRAGYTKSIRPPVAITRVEKRENAKSYSYTGDLADAEYDHLVSLVLGGDPNDPRNLWVEPPSPGHKPRDGVNNPKDVVESRLASAVCSGRVPLADAQVAIATDWTTALDRLGLRK
ncbi:hypothetical protein BKG82_18760 [Mycobacteroides chelonae]|uniref:Lipoprotein n=1 Tax=Mycobacteroides chelonae TaxID=1774 RepID=A0A1S1LHI4_MYCCH|nr:hypothetical protein [Mycobacteroides chelonae]OHU52311.1 hypothetical protein BKG82_18760 [Mycobacteroides chelonae]